MNKTSKFVISITSMFVIGICLMIYIFIYTSLLNNNMEVCMEHYKDYNYCVSKVNKGKSE